MSATNPVDALFGGMDKLGPGSNRDTQHVLGLLPIKRFSVTVDAGCGAGRQTIVLAKDLGTPIQAVDSYEPFLNHLKQCAKEMGVEHLVRTHCMDMKDISTVFPHIDLLWAEGAAYNIGFSNALSIWATAIKLDGFAVVSELCWLQPSAAASLCPARSSLVALHRCLNSALGGQINGETAEPVSTFVMFARHRRQSGVTMRIRRGLECRPARIVIRKR